MRKRARTHVEAPGQDSFLDVVANLVGILIILVMIIGARAKDVIQHGDADAPAPTEQTTEVDQARQAMAVEGQIVSDLTDKVRQQQFEVSYRHNERDRMLELIKTVEGKLAAQRDKLDTNSQLAHVLRTHLAQAESELSDLELTRKTLQDTKPPVTLIKHRPTPLAKTVFGHEIHFRLAQGRITYVPLGELVEKFKNEARAKVWKLRQSPSITDTVGPIGGFRLRYTLKKVDRKVSTSAGVVNQQSVELDHFTVVPVSEELGEPFQVALQPKSKLRSVLESYDPSHVTVTVWVYPDSYSQFHQLKEALYQMGFLTAGRPMPADQPITGSPNGTRSAAQ